jgi:hypothetical protein
MQRHCGEGSCVVVAFSVWWRLASAPILLRFQRFVSSKARCLQVCVGGRALQLHHLLYGCGV